jgi:hypothetical protein
MYPRFKLVPVLRRGCLLPNAERVRSTRQKLWSHVARAGVGTREKAALLIEAAIKFSAVNFFQQSDHITTSIDEVPQTPLDTRDGRSKTLVTSVLNH